MKRLLIVLALVSIMLAGCSGGSKVDIAPAEAATTLLSEVAFRDTLVEAQGDVAKEWYSFDDKVESFAVYISGSGATAEEIAVIKSSDAKTAKATVEKRVADLKFRFEDYMPAEMTKLNDPVIVTKGDIVVLVLADDSAQAKSAVDDLFK